jgi:ribosomal subunit interface protein
MSVEFYPTRTEENLVPFLEYPGCGVSILKKGFAPMKLGFAFRSVDSSEALMSHLSDRLEKLGRFELNPMDVQVIISMVRHECSVEVTMTEGRRKYKANAVSDDFYRSAEMCVNKLQRQLSKERRRKHDINHRRPEQSTEGKLARLTPTLESDYKRDYKKTG